MKKKKKDEKVEADETKIITPDTDCGTTRRKHDLIPESVGVRML